MPSISMEKAITFMYQSHSINVHDQLISLTDLWKAAGEPEGKHDPRRWKDKAGQEFIEAVAKKLNVPSGDIYKTVRGKHGGGSWAHWQIALAYAKYLSHELHMHVNSVYMRYQSGDVKLADEIADKASPHDQEWLAKRVAGKVQRNYFTHVLSDHGVAQNWEYGRCTNAIYKPILGGEAALVRQQRKLGKRGNVRDALTVNELVTVAFAELASGKRIEREKNQGVKECSQSCELMAKKVASLLS